jgi:hypothetical protein
MRLLCPLGAFSVFSVVFLSFPFFVLLLLCVPVDVTTVREQEPQGKTWGTRPVLLNDSS